VHHAKFFNGEVSIRYFPDRYVRAIYPGGFAGSFHKSEGKSMGNFDSNRLRGPEDQEPPRKNRDGESFEYNETYLPRGNYQGRLSRYDPITGWSVDPPPSKRDPTANEDRKAMDAFGRKDQPPTGQQFSDSSGNRRSVDQAVGAGDGVDFRDQAKDLPSHERWLTESTSGVTPELKEDLAMMRCLDQNPDWWKSR
jgi:hypothetical protein